MRILAFLAFALLGFTTPAAAPVPTTDTTFSMQFFNRYSPTQGLIQSRFFHAERGPQDQRRLFTGVRLVPVVNGGGDFLGIENGRVIHVTDNSSGTNELSAVVNLGDWVMSLAFDSQRNRNLMTSLSGEGAFYKRAAINTWSFLASLNNRDLESIVYRPSDDSIWGLEVRNSTNGTTLMQRYSAEGTAPQEWNWAAIPVEIRPGGLTSEMVMTDDDAIILMVERPYSEIPQRGDVSRMYVIRPEFGWFIPTFEKKWARSPQVSILAPTNQATLVRTDLATITVRASDPDGDLVKIELFNGYNVNEISSTTFSARGENTVSSDWRPPSYGPIHLRAVATDAQGATNEAFIDVTVIPPPPGVGIRIQSPRDGVSVIAGTPLPIATVSTNVSGGGSVRYFVDGSQIGERLIPKAILGDFPSNYIWTNTNASIGVHTLTAVLLNQDRAFTSAPVRVTLLGNPRGRAPVVRFITPPMAVTTDANLGEPLHVVVEFSDVDNDAAGIDLFDGSFRLNRWAFAPSPSGTNRVEFDWTPTAPGSHILRATIYDLKQNTSETKTTVRVVTPPTIVVERSLPDIYTYGQTVQVALWCLPSSTVSAYAIEEQPPAGWTLVFINSDGVLDPASGKIKWGPFTDAQQRVVGYTIKAPTNSLAEAVFTGSGSANGVSKPTVGDQSIAFFSPHHPADRAPDDSRITIDELTAYAAAWKKGTDWPVAPARVPLAYMTRAGFLWKNGEAYHFESKIAPPYCWVSDYTNTRSLLPVAQALDANEVLRALPPAFTPGRPVTVTIHARPGAGVRNYALQDEPPAGWAIRAGEDAAIVRGSVRFGPFYDDHERTFTYVVTPPADSMGGAFRGAASFDGSREALEGASILRHSHAVAERDGNGGLRLRFHATPGQRFDVETAPRLDAADWQTIGQIEGAETPVDFQAIEPADGERYFRLRPISQ